MTTVLIWDGPTEDLIEDHSIYDVVYFWSDIDFASDSQVASFSLPALTEKSRMSVRQSYLEIVQIFANSYFFGKTLHQLLRIHSTTSLWWSSLIQESCNFDKSPEINNLLKAIVLYDHIDRFYPKITSIKVYSDSRLIKRSLSLYAQTNKITLTELKPSVSSSYCVTINRAYLLSIIPKPVAAVVWLCYFIARNWSLFQLSPEIEPHCQITLFSYLISPSSKHGTPAEFLSHYWGNLPLHPSIEHEKKTFVYLYMPTPSIPSSHHARRIVDRLNSTDLFSTHISLESFFSFKLLLKTLLSFLKFSWLGIRIYSKSCFYPVISPYLSIFLDNDFRSSLYGHQLLKSLLYYYLLEQLSALIPPDTLTIYLQENQDWEYLMLQIFMSRRNSTTLGIPHSTVRFWDLRYFASSCTSSFSAPVPTYQGLNSDHAFTMLSSYNSCLQKKYPVEALRYQHLVSGTSLPSLSAASPAHEHPKVLIIGEYNKAITTYLCNLVISLPQFFFDNYDFILKPHPSSSSTLINSISSTQIHISNDPLDLLLPRCSIAVTGSVSSAAVEAYMYGATTISINAPFSLNMSPLDGLKDVHFITSKTQLTDILLDRPCQHSPRVQAASYFYNGTSLNLWSNLIARLYPLQHSTSN